MAARKSTSKARKDGTHNSVKRAPRGKGKPFQPGHPYRFQPGQSGNPGGRPKSLGVAYSEWLEQEWLHGLNNAQAVAQAVGRKAKVGNIQASVEIRTAVSQVQQPAGTESSAVEIKSFPADLLAPSFLNVYRDVKAKRHTEYVLSGGRGSTKSTFVSEIIVYLLLTNPDIHAVATRQVADTMRGSVYSQLQWAIAEFGLTDKFKFTISPLEIEYLPTHQKIYFRGGDDPGKMKSIRPPTGYIGILWFEELDQFRGPESVRKIEQSVIRGGDEAFIFKSFNPPRTSGNWANKYLQIPKASQFQHSSNYLTVPPEWLGQTFLDEAEHLKTVNPQAYEHEYLGVVNGMGGQVFSNVKIRKITDEEIAQFDRVLCGADWGFFPDPFAFVKCYYKPSQLRLYIYDEYGARKKANRVVYDDLVTLGKLTADQLVIADSSEPKSVADFREYGATIRGAEKGPDSIAYSMKWLQSLVEIVIDPERAPESCQEFLDYELEKDKDGEYISSFPDANNHFIDGTRYATNLIWRRRGQ